MKELDTLVQEVDSKHYLYHFRSSFLHLEYAEHLKSNGELEKAADNYKEALFQDHQNEFAKNWREREERAIYTSHIETRSIEKLAEFEEIRGFLPYDCLDLIAKNQFEAAIYETKKRHEAYHEFASTTHVQRGKYFMKQKNYDLAIADFTKALDLWKENKEAKKLRKKSKMKVTIAELGYFTVISRFTLGSLNNLCMRLASSKERSSSK